MGLSRSTYYAAREAAPAEAVLVAEIREITDAFECYGYRRVGAELRHRGQVVNAKKVRRLMRENDLNPRKRRGFAHTTDSDDDGPVFPFVARNLADRRPRPALGRRHHLRRDRTGLRLSLGDPRRLVAAGHRPCARPRPRGPAQRRRPRTGDRAPPPAAGLRLPLRPRRAVRLPGAPRALPPSPTPRFTSEGASVEVWRNGAAAGRALTAKSQSARPGAAGGWVPRGWVSP